MIELYKKCNSFHFKIKKNTYIISYFVYVISAEIEYI